MRCFIFGAGFSRAAGYPLGGDLIGRAKAAVCPNEVTNAPWDWFETWWNAESEWLRVFFPQHPNVDAADVELLFTLMDLRMRQLQAVDDEAARVYWRQASVRAIASGSEQAVWDAGHDSETAARKERIRNAQRALNEAIYGLFDVLDSSSAHLPPYVAQIADVFEPKDVCVTLNYDLLLERSLMAANRWRVEDGWGFKVAVQRATTRRPPRSEVAILKLHGSFGWRIRRDGAMGMEDHVLQRLDPNICRAVGFAMSGASWIDKQMALLAPSYLKPIDTLALRPIWRAAMAWLQKASQWIVCGYSLPAADLGLRSLLTLADRPTKQVFVLDPIRSVAARFAALLGRPVQWIGTTAADWATTGGNLSAAVTVGPLDGGLPT